MRILEQLITFFTDLFIMLSNIFSTFHSKIIEGYMKLLPKINPIIYKKYDPTTIINMVFDSNYLNNNLK